MPEILKRCTICGQQKPATAEFFIRSKRMADGIANQCKECNRERGRRYAALNADKVSQKKSSYAAENRDKINERRRRWRDKNREKEREQNRRRRSADPEKARAKERQQRAANAEKAREKVRRWRNNNPEKNRESKRKTRLATLEVSRQRSSRWKKDNPEKHAIHEQRRNARKLNLPDTMTHTQWHHCLSYFNHCCAACGRSIDGLSHKPHADHWSPLSDPGCPGTIATNIIPLCGGQDGCNNSKRNRPATAWLESKFGKRKATEILAKIETYFAWVRTQDA